MTLYYRKLLHVPRLRLPMQPASLQHCRHGLAATSAMIRARPSIAPRYRGCYVNSWDLLPRQQFIPGVDLLCTKLTMTSLCGRGRSMSESKHSEAEMIGTLRHLEAVRKT